MKVELEMEIVSCANCGIPIVASAAFFKIRREDHQYFYCISGHNNYYSGKSEAEKLRDQLAQEQRKNAALQQQLNKATFPKKRGRPRKNP